MRDLPLLKRGSVKNLRGPLPDAPNEIVFEFTDDFSVFDWGKMPDAIPEKGRSLLSLAASLFRELSHPASWQDFFRAGGLPEIPATFQNLFPDLRRELESVGMRSCFRGTYPRESREAEGLIVEALEGIPPVATPQGFNYGNALTDAPGKLIPLEVVFRHALTEKSSYFERNPGTALRSGHRFEFPLVETFTKLEPTDRFIPSDGEACAVGRISEDRLLELKLRTILLSLWLKRECELRSLELIDGKFEWGFDREGRMMLADAIGPDELRLVEAKSEGQSSGSTRAEPLSKEFLREYFRDTAWFREIQKLKEENRQTSGWQKLVTQPAPRLPAEGIARAVSLYRKLAARFRTETVLLFGSGGREHEIARRLLDSPNIRTLIWAPGQDAGFAQLEALIAGTPAGTRKRLVRWDDGAWSEEESAALITRAREASVTLAVFSQDGDLAAGAADRFREAGFSVFGPSREAARIEWSKSFSKELCLAAGVPTARAEIATSRADAERVIRELSWDNGAGWVLKADGLALGKGVVVAENREQALASLDSLSRYGEEFLIEARLLGEECSWFAFADGETFSLLDPAKDYKRLCDGQLGPNTGGMGSVSPAPGTTPEFRERIRNEVFAPVFSELRKRGIRYQGLLYAGIMFNMPAEAASAGGKITENLRPFSVLEFNARFGDPETQALLPRLARGNTGDLLLWMSACARGTLSDYPRDVPFRTETTVYVVAAAEGYPEKPRTGVSLPLDLEKLRNDRFRFAGVKYDSPSGEWKTSGGRVLGAVGFGENTESARNAAYALLETVRFPGAQFRKDIGR